MICGNGQRKFSAIKSLAIIAASLCLSAPARGQGGLTIATNGLGLSSLQYGGNQFLGDGDFRVNGIFLQSGSSAPFYAALTPTTVTIYPALQTLTPPYTLVT